MKKILLLSLTFLISISSFSQNKFGYIDSQELLLLMPERKTAEEVNRYLTKPEIEKKIREVRKYMEKAAKSLDFIEAAKFRDEIKSLQKQLSVI